MMLKAGAGDLDGNVTGGNGGNIHSKSWFHWFPETAENFEFSAERLSEKAKTVNSLVCVRNET